MNELKIAIIKFAWVMGICFVTYILLLLKYEVQ
jgi:hypothetical protein